MSTRSTKDEQARTRTRAGGGREHGRVGTRAGVDRDGGSSIYIPFGVAKASTDSIGGARPQELCDIEPNEQHLLVVHCLARVKEVVAYLCSVDVQLKHPDARHVSTFHRGGRG